MTIGEAVQKLAPSIRSTWDYIAYDAYALLEGESPEDQNLIAHDMVLNGAFPIEGAEDVFEAFPYDEVLAACAKAIDLL